MSCSKLQFGLCRVSCALFIALLRASYLLTNELDGKGDGESMIKLGKPACKLVSHFTSRFHLVEYAVYHVFDPQQ
jgi:hypothetical protein